MISSFITWYAAMMDVFFSLIPHCDHVLVLAVSYVGVEGSGHGPEAADSMQFSSSIAYPCLVQNTVAGSPEEVLTRSISGFMKLKLSWIGEDDCPAKAPPRSMYVSVNVRQCLSVFLFANVFRPFVSFPSSRIRNLF
jgi:hypothetical protein